MPSPRHRGVDYETIAVARLDAPGGRIRDGVLDVDDRHPLFACAPDDVTFELAERTDAPT